MLPALLSPIAFYTYPLLEILNTYNNTYRVQTSTSIYSIQSGFTGLKKRIKITAIIIYNVIENENKRINISQAL